MENTTKRLAFIINVFREDNFHSGGEKLFYELVSNSIKDGYIVDLYCSKYLYSSVEPTLNLNKLTILGNSKNYKYPNVIESLYCEIRKLIEKENYDRIISENITPPFDIAVLQGHSSQHYMNMAGNLFEKIIFKIKKFKQINYHRKWFKQGYNKIFVPSNILKNELIKNFNLSEDKFVVAYPGVVIPENIVNIDYNSIFDKSKFVTFGISAPSFSKKGGYIFIEALKLLKKQGFNFKAKIIYPKYKKNIKLKLLLKLYNLVDNVEFLSYQADMNQFYRSIECIVMPSLLETFGLVALESMANKRVAIVSNYSGASEIIENNKNGFIFDISNNSAQNLSEKMKTLLNNKHLFKEISDNAYKTALNFSWKSAYDKFKANVLLNKE